MSSQHACTSSLPFVSLRRMLCLPTESRHQLRHGQFLKPATNPFNPVPDFGQRGTIAKLTEGPRINPNDTRIVRPFAPQVASDFEMTCRFHPANRMYELDEMPW